MNRRYGEGKGDSSPVILGMSIFLGYRNLSGRIGTPLVVDFSL